jgi:hypothetical protein
MAGEDKLTPTNLERLTYKQPGWNYILDRNMEIINFHLTAIGNLLDVDTTGIRHNSVLGWKTTASKWQPMYAITTTSTTISGTTTTTTTSPAGFPNGWTYKKSVPLSRASGAVTNYQMKLTVYRSSGTDGAGVVYIGTDCEADYKDLRFTASDGTTLLDYWIESYDASSAVIWIEFDSIGTSATTFYMYYGNASAVAYSNGENTFPLFDDFLGTSIDGTKWTYSGTPTVGGSEVNGSINSISTFGDNYALRCRAKVPAANQKYVVGWGDSQLATYDFSYRTPASAPQWAKEGFPSPGTTTLLATNFDANYHIFNIGKISTTYYFSMDNVNDGTLSPCSDPSLADKVVLYRADATWDWVLVRQSLSVEPAWGSWGSREAV